MKHAQIDGHGTHWVERVRLMTKSLVLAIVGVTLVALPASGQGPDARLQILNTGINLGHVNGIIATEVVTPGNIGEIGGGLADATAALSALATTIASPYSPGGFVRANRRIAFISENVGAWSRERALREIGQVRSIVLGALRVYFDSRRGAVVSRSGGTCDSAIFRVGFHYGTGHTAVQRGNTNLERRSRSSMRQAIRSGQAAAASLTCEFPGAAYAAVPMMGTPTPGGYDSSLAPLQVATSGGPTPPGPVASVPPPPPPTPTPQPGRNFCATVTSKKGWQEINVPAGFRTISQITGSWNVYHAHRKAGPEGYKGALEDRMHEEYKQYKYVKTVPFAALLMKDGSSSGIVWVQQTPHAFSGQRLLFRVNDTDDTLSDNSGALEVCFGQ